MMRVLAACAAGIAMALLVTPAHAADSGTLLITPAQGTLDTPIDVVTSGVCTRGVTFVVAVRGEGLDPATAGNAVGNTELRILEPAPYPGHHAVPLSRSLREFFTTNGVSAPAGAYDLVFACRNRLDMADLQTFTGTIRVDRSGSYRALEAAAVPLQDFLARPATTQPTATSAAGGDETPTPPSEPSETAAVSNETEEPAGEPAGSDTSASPSAALVDTGETPEAFAMTETSSSVPTQQDDTWRYALIGLGILLLAGAAYMGWKARAR